MVNHINHTRSCHVVTIEDPVEYLHTDDLAAIDQREVGFDTDSFSSAMRVVLRQDPDVILVGEMRDMETVSAALTAAETGHLVFSTLHTINATETDQPDRGLLPSAPADTGPGEPGRITQGHHLPATDPHCRRQEPGAGARAPGGQRTGSNRPSWTRSITGDIEGIVADGEYYGMMTFDQSLVTLIADGTIDLVEAMNTAINPHDLKVMLERKGIMQTGSSPPPTSPDLTRHLSWPDSFLPAPTSPVAI